jgi:hypothetical protein
VPDTFLGRRVKCPKCQQPFTVTAAPEPPPAKAPAAPAAARPKTPPPAARPEATIPVTPRLAPQRPPASPPPRVQEDALDEVVDEEPPGVEVVDVDVGEGGVAPVTGGSVQYLRAVQYIFENPKWVTNVLLLAVCYLIPVVGPLVGSGYLFDLVEWLSARGNKGYPDFDFGRFGKYLMRGLWPFLVSLIVYLPVWMILGVVGVVAAMILPEILVRLYSAVEYLLLALVFPLALMPLWLYTGLSQSFNVGGAFKFAPDFFKRVGKEAVIAQLLLSFGGGVLLMIGFALCCIGYFLAIAILILAYANLYAQLYQVYLQRGGPPIPLKQEAAADVGEEPV